LKNEQSKTKILAGKRTSEDSQLDGTETLLDAFDKIRSCDDSRFPAFFIVEGEKVFISLSRSEFVERENHFDI
jgi:hypothetical protein